MFYNFTKFYYTSIRIFHFIFVASKFNSSDRVYSLALNSSGSILASGSSDSAIMVWDLRTNDRAMRLEGHSINIKSLVVSPDGQKIISGGSDSLIKVWSIGEQQCVNTIKHHSEGKFIISMQWNFRRFVSTKNILITGVWALLATDSFSHVVSGSRDKKIFVTELRNPSNRTLICEEQSWIKSLCHNIDQTGIWVSRVQNWNKHDNSKSIFSNIFYLQINILFVLYLL